MTKKNNYDIFVSYRRADAGDKAEHLKDLLEAIYKGNISFDRENLSGLFDVELARRIDACKDFLLVLGKDSLKFEDEDLTEDKVKLYQFLGSCPIDAFEKKIIELGPNANLDFVRIEIARALNHKGLNIIPVVPEKTERFNFSDIKLPDDIAGIKRYEAIFYSDNPDALFKDVIPKLRPHIHTKPTKSLGRFIYPAICALLLAGLGAYLWHRHQVKETYAQLQDKHSEFLLKLNPNLTKLQLRVIDDILDKMKLVGDKFWMSKFEFTQSQWYGIINEAVDPAMKDMPITDVSFGEIAFRLDSLSNMTGIYFELPSLDEWEYAAHGGEKNETTLYAGSDDPGKVAWYMENSGGKMHPSNGQDEMEPNQIDLFNMSGNVGEWCNERFPSTAESLQYAVCGGNYNSPASEVTITSRIGMDTSAKDKTVGFRVIIRKQ